MACEGKKRAGSEKIKEKCKVKVAQDFLGTRDVEAVDKLLDNLEDYGDNAIRYFRLTRYLFIRGGGFFVDLEPRRQVEIVNLLKYDSAESLDFPSEEAYMSYLADIKQPELPWEKEPELIKIVEVALKEIERLIEELKNRSITAPAFIFRDYLKFNKEQLKEYIERLRGYRRELNDAKIHCESQEIGRGRRVYWGPQRNL